MSSTSVVSSPKRDARSLHGWLLTSTCWLGSTGAVLIAPVLPFMQRDFSSVKYVELLTLVILVVPGLMIALFSPLVGTLVDRFGKKRFYLLAILLYAAFGILPFWLTNLYAILASRVVIGLAEAAIATIATALVANYFNGVERQKWLTMQQASASVVAVVMFSLGGVLGGLPAGWRTPFLVYGFAIVFLPLIAVFIWEPEGDDRALTARAPKLPFPWRLIGHICVTIIFASIMFFVVPVQISFLLAARGVSTPALIGAGSAIANAGIPIGGFLFHRFSKWSINRLLTLSFCLFTVGFCVIASLPEANAAVVGAFIAGVGGGMALPLLGTWLVARLPFEQSGRGTGGYVGAFFLGNFLSPFVVAAIGHVSGGLFSAIGWLAVLCGVATAVTLALTLSRRGPTESVRSVEVRAIGH
ncbi:MFS transporter [Paraburkholderia sp. EG287A]|uniref:MFS transporter n=1 Tax=unclassified Paraburkholderia TaxID=2615204 RepID=UPI0034D30E54